MKSGELALYRFR